MYVDDSRSTKHSEQRYTFLQSLIVQRQPLTPFLPNGLKETSHKRMKPGVAFPQTLKEVRAERLSMVVSFATEVTGIPLCLARSPFS